jgi:hypothetical protein
LSPDVESLSPKVQIGKPKLGYRHVATKDMESQICHCVSAPTFDESNDLGGTNEGTNMHKLGQAGSVHMDLSDCTLASPI